MSSSAGAPITTSNDSVTFSDLSETPENTWNSEYVIASSYVPVATPGFTLNVTVSISVSGVTALAKLITIL